MLISNLTILVIFNFLYMVGLSILYFSKVRVNNRENKIYKVMLISNLFGLILQFLCDIVSWKFTQLPRLISDIIFRLYLIYFIVWIICMVIYLIEISFKNKKKYTAIVIICCVIEIVVSFFLPYSLYRNVTTRVYYTYGYAVSYIYLLSGINCFLMGTILVLKNKVISLKKTIPIYLFILFGIIAALVQMFRPDIVIITSMESFLCCLMYFTIENPDTKMIEEIHAAKDYTDNLNAEKSLFIFNMSQEIKLPVGELSEIHKDILLEDNVEEIKNKTRIAEDFTKKISDVVNSVLDISSIDSHNMKIVNNKYNVKVILKELVSMTKKNIGEKPIDLRINIDKNIPEMLYGDSIRVKQVINTVLDNAVKYTSKGFVELSINSIMKQDICRLIINVEDSGKGMNSETINKLFTPTNKSEEELINNTGIIKFDLANARKLLNLIGGTIIVKSEVNVGTKITIVIDQKTVNEENKELEVLDKYKDLFMKKVRILVVDDNESSIKMFRKILTKENIELEESSSGKQCLDRIRNKEKYDLILLDEKMDKLTGYDTMKKLKMINNFNIPVILTTHNNNIQFSDDYLSYGFSNYLLKPFTKDSLLEILDKYIK